MEQDPQPLEGSHLDSNFASLPLKSISLQCALLSREKKECCFIVYEKLASVLLIFDDNDLGDIGHRHLMNLIKEKLEYVIRPLVF